MLRSNSELKYKLKPQPQSRPRQKTQSTLTHSLDTMSRQSLQNTMLISIAKEILPTKYHGHIKHYAVVLKEKIQGLKLFKKTQQGTQVKLPLEDLKNKFEKIIEDLKTSPPSHYNHHSVFRHAAINQTQQPLMEAQILEKIPSPQSIDCQNDSLNYFIQWYFTQKTPNSVKPPSSAPSYMRCLSIFSCIPVSIFSCIPVCFSTAKLHPGSSSEGTLIPENQKELLPATPYEEKSYPEKLKELLAATPLDYTKIINTAFDFTLTLPTPGEKDITDKYDEKLYKFLVCSSEIINTMTSHLPATHSEDLLTSHKLKEAINILKNDLKSKFKAFNLKLNVNLAPSLSEDKNKILFLFGVLLKESDFTKDDFDIVKNKLSHYLPSVSSTHTTPSEIQNSLHLTPKTFKDGAMSDLTGPTLFGSSSVPGGMRYSGYQNPEKEKNKKWVELEKHTYDILKVATQTNIDVDSKSQIINELIHGFIQKCGTQPNHSKTQQLLDHLTPLMKRSSNKNFAKSRSLTLARQTKSNPNLIGFYMRVAQTFTSEIDGAIDKSDRQKYTGLVKESHDRHDSVKIILANRIIGRLLAAEETSNVPFSFPNFSERIQAVIYPLIEQFTETIDEKSAEIPRRPDPEITHLQKAISAIVKTLLYEKKQEILSTYNVRIQSLQNEIDPSAIESPDPSENKVKHDKIEELMRIKDQINGATFTPGNFEHLSSNIDSFITSINDIIRNEQDPKPEPLLNLTLSPDELYRSESFMKSLKDCIDNYISSSFEVVALIASHSYTIEEEKGAELKENYEALEYEQQARIQLLQRRVRYKFPKQASLSSTSHEEPKGTVPNSARDAADAGTQISSAISLTSSVDEDDLKTKIEQIHLLESLSNNQQTKDELINILTTGITQKISSIERSLISENQFRLETPFEFSNFEGITKYNIYCLLKLNCQVGDSTVLDGRISPTYIESQILDLLTEELYGNIDGITAESGLKTKFCNIYDKIEFNETNKSTIKLHLKCILIKLIRDLQCEFFRTSP